MDFKASSFNKKDSKLTVSLIYENLDFKNYPIFWESYSELMIG